MKSIPRRRGCSWGTRLVLGPCCDRGGAHPTAMSAGVPSPAWVQGLVRVVEALATLPNVLTQKDRDWQTAFDVCEDAATGELLCRLRAERG